MHQQLNPKRIALARNIRGVSQGELAQKIGCANQAALSNVETGKLTFDEDMAVKIAEVLGFPVSFFSRESNHTRLSKFYYRKRNAFPASELVPLEGKIDAIRSGYLELLKAVDITVRQLPAIPVTSKNKPENIAKLFRLFLGLNDDPIDNLVSLIEKLGIPVLLLKVSSDKFSGMTVQTDINMPIIVLNKKMPNDHKKFTLAHELGHLIMHIPFAEDPLFFEHLEDFDSVEKQADTFAGAFLVPEEKAKYTLQGLTYSKLTDLKIYWKVSKQALIYRAKELGIITESKYKTLFIELSRYGERKNEKIEIPLDAPVLFRKMIDVHITQLGYSKSELAEEKFGISERDFVEWFDFESTNKLRVAV